MKTLWSSEVRGTKLENFRTWCENSTVHGCEISHQFMGANFRTTVHGCEISHQFMGANFRTTVHGCEIFAPVCKLFSVLCI